jgi:drug/metabolite transporter (DMT)-like permease
MLFMVIYSSIIVFAAVIRWRVFGKPLSTQQSLALAIITIGLVITAFDGAETGNTGSTAADNASSFSLSSSTQSDSPDYVVHRNGGRSLLFNAHAHSSAEDGPVDPGRIIAGMCLALMGAFGYAVVYVLTEQVTVQDGAPDPFAFASFSGFYGSVVVASYMVLAVGPAWQEIVIEPMEARQTSYGHACAVYMGLLFMCGAHNLSFVFLGKNGGGAVVAGVNKAVQTISVFVASAVWFGPDHAEQRMTSFKIMALILVVIGVLVYSAAPKVKGLPTIARAPGGDDEGKGQDKVLEMASHNLPSPAGTLSQRGGYSALRVVDLDEAA